MDIVEGKVDVKIPSLDIRNLKKYLINNNISNRYIKKISPFEIPLDFDNGKIKIVSLLRVLPGRRLTFIGILSDGKQAIVQLFINDHKYSKDLKRVLKNYNLCIENSLLTPLIINSKIDNASQLSYIVTEYVNPDAISRKIKVNDISSNRISSRDNIDIYQQKNKYNIIIESIAKLHSVNLYQKDIHVDNFILSDGKVYYIDLSSINSLPKYNKLSYALNNFALYLAQLSVRNYINYHEYINCYLDCLGKYINYNSSVYEENHQSDETNSSNRPVKFELNNLSKKFRVINKIRSLSIRSVNNLKNIESINRNKIFDYIMSSYDNQLSNRLNKFNIKCYRECSLFEEISRKKIANNKIGSVKIDGVFNKKYSSRYKFFLSEFINNQDQAINKYLDKTIKSGNTAKLYLLNHNNNLFIVKKYLNIGLYESLINYFKYKGGKMRAQKSWVNANMLELVGIKTANPIAMLFNKQGILIKDSYFIMEYVPELYSAHEVLSGNVPIHDLEYANEKNNKHKLNLSLSIKYIKKIKILLEQLRHLKLVHRDFKTVNFGFANNDIYLLDLDAMQRYKSNLFYRMFKYKDQNRMLKCWRNNKEILDLFNSELVAVDS